MDSASRGSFSDYLQVPRTFIICKLKAYLHSFATGSSCNCAFRADALTAQHSRVSPWNPHGRQMESLLLTGCHCSCRARVRLRPSFIGACVVISENSIAGTAVKVTTWDWCLGSVTLHYRLDSPKMLPGFMPPLLWS